MNRVVRDILHTYVYINGVTERQLRERYTHSHLYWRRVLLAGTRLLTHCALTSRITPSLFESRFSYFANSRPGKRPPEDPTIDRPTGRRWTASHAIRLLHDSRMHLCICVRIPDYIIIMCPQLHYECMYIRHKIHKMDHEICTYFFIYSAASCTYVCMYVYTSLGISKSKLHCTAAE